ncbi:MAG: caspase family protein [Bacteroidota bacterium]
MSVKLPFTTSHAFIIGNDQYQHVSKLKTAVKDARDISALLKGEHQYQIHALYDATKEQMEQMFSNMPKIVNANDRVIFYFAGHGIAIDSEKDPEGYLVPVDAESKGISKLVPMKLLHDALLNLPCKHGLLILDCCFAGSFKWSTGYRSLFIREKQEQLYEERFMRFVEHPAWQVITSSASDQKALDGIQPDNLGARNTMTDNKNSPFAFALQQAIKLKGRAKEARGKRSDGVITATELYSYVRRMVEDESKKQGSKQSPAIFTLSKHDSKGEFIFLEPGHRLNLPKAPDQNPYQGLKAYKTQEQHSKMFFGREQAIASMSRRMEKTPILLVSAPSGQGKSSTVMAGLIPALQQTIHDQTGEYLMLRPSDQESKKWAKLGQLNVEEPHLILVDQYEEMFHQEEADRSEKEALLIAFYGKLHSFILQHRKLPATRLILTMRSDFEWQMKQSAFGRAFWEEEHVLRFLYRLPPMEREELREAMVQPAYLLAYDFESEELIGRILDEVQHAPGALPLLSFTLQKLYESRDYGKRLFTEKAYFEKLGGVNGALSTHADRVFTSLKDIDQQDFMRKLMLRMVRLNDGSYSRRKVYRTYDSKRLDKALDELDYPDHQDPTVEAVLKVMEETQLIVIGKDEVGTYVEPIHDSLINFWPRCLNWVQAFRRENIVLQRQIWQAVLEYHQLEESEESATEDVLGKRPSSLWNNNPKLQQIQIAVTDPRYEWLVERELPDSPISSLSFLLWEDNPSDRELAILEKWDWHFQQADLQKRYEAVLAQMDNWLNEAEVAFVKESFARQQTELERAIKQRDEAIKARELAEKRTKEAEAAAITAIARTTPREKLTTRLKLMQAAYAKTLPDPPKPMVSQTLADVCFDQLQRDGKPPVYVPTAYIPRDKGDIRNITLSPDGSLVFAIYASAASLITSQGRLIKEWTWEHELVDSRILFSPNSKYLLLYIEASNFGDEAELSLWNIKGDRLKDLNNGGASNHNQFSADSKYLLIRTRGPNNVPNSELYSLKKESITLIPFPGQKENEYYSSYFGGVEFASNSRFLLGYSLNSQDVEQDFMLIMWDIKSEKAHSLLPLDSEHPTFIYSQKAFFSPDGSYVLGISDDLTVNLWKTEGIQHIELGKLEDDQSPKGFSPSNQLILIRSKENQYQIWSVEGKLEYEYTLSKPETFSRTSAVFSSDSKKVLVEIEKRNEEGVSRSIILWDLAENQQSSIIHEDNTTDLDILNFLAKDQCILIQTSESYEIRDLEGEVLLRHEIPYRRHEKYGLSKEKNIQILPKGQGFIGVLKNGAIQQVDLSGQTICTLDHHAKDVTDIQISNDGSSLLVHSSDKRAKVWTLPIQGRLVSRFERADGVRGKENLFWEAIWSPNHKLLLANAYGHSSHLWSKEGESIRMFPKAEGFRVQFSQDSQTLLVPRRDISRCELWTTKGELITDFNSEVTEASFIPHGQNILVLSKAENEKGRLSIWTNEGKEKMILDQSFTAYGDMTFSPDGASFVVKDWNKKAVFWMNKGHVRKEFDLGYQEMNRCEFSSNAAYFMMVLDTQAQLRSKAGDLLETYDLKRNGYRTEIRFSPTSEYLFIGGTSVVFLIRLSDCHQIEMTKTLFVPHHGIEFKKVTFSPDGQRLITVSGIVNEEITRIWDLEGNVLKELDQMSMEKLEFSPDAKWLISVSWIINQRSIMVLRNEEAENLMVVEQSEERISNIQWFSNSQLFISVTHQALNLWNTYGDRLASWELGDHTSFLGISPDENYILVSAQDTPIQMWPIPEVWFQYLEETTDIPELSEQEKEDLGLNF